jgi:ribosomal protein S27AE
MARTYKDKNPIYRMDKDLHFKTKDHVDFRRRYANFKRSGPPLDTENCPQCGGLIEYVDGYLNCTECGWTEISGFEELECA